MDVRRKLFMPVYKHAQMNDLCNLIGLSFFQSSSDHNQTSTLLTMRANIGTILVGSKVVLVPYRPEHVPVRKLCIPQEPSGRILTNAIITEVPFMDA